MYIHLRAEFEYTSEWLMQGFFFVLTANYRFKAITGEMFLHIRVILSLMLEL